MKKKTIKSYNGEDGKDCVIKHNSLCGIHTLLKMLTKTLKDNDKECIPTAILCIEATIDFLVRKYNTQEGFDDLKDNDRHKKN